MITLLDTTIREVEASLEGGRGEAVAAIDLADLRESFTGDDPVTDYLFAIWFRRPVISTLYEAAQNGVDRGADGDLRDSPRRALASEVYGTRCQAARSCGEGSGVR